MGGRAREGQSLLELLLELDESDELLELVLDESLDDEEEEADVEDDEPLLFEP